MLCEGEPPELPAELEGGEDGVLAGEGDEGGRGEGPVGVNTTSGVPETVLSSRLCAVLTPAPDVVRRWQSGSSVQQDLDDLVVVGVSR